MSHPQVTPATPDSTDGLGHGQPPQPTPPHRNTTRDHDELAAYKVTRGTSCMLCQHRKVRCDKQKPCSNCIRAGTECRVVPPKPPQRKKKKVSEVDLIARLRKYESMLAAHGIAFEPLGPDVTVTDAGSRLDEGNELDTDFIPLAKAGSPDGPEDSDIITAPGENPHMPKTFKWFPKESRPSNNDHGAHNSSSEEDVGSTINAAYDQMFHRLDFPFGNGAGYESMTDEHPTPAVILELWRIYLRNVDPLLKITHAPTIEAQMRVASNNLDKVSRSMEALMFSIYLMAITSLTEDEVQATFQESRMGLLNRYIIATQQALLNAEFMRTPDLTLLQAFLLYCMGVRQFVDPRTLFCVSGINVRLAHRLGLHRDGAQYSLSPFEVEQRRRLWWNIAAFDRRVGETTGSTITAISTGGDCELPLNIDDFDLDEKATNVPKSRSGATDMIFAATRLEFAKGPGNDKMATKSSTANPQAVTNLADVRLTTFLERFSVHMENQYMKHLDPRIPLHKITLLLTRMQMCKLKIMSGFFRKAVDSQTPSAAYRGPSFAGNQDDYLFIEAIKMLKYDMEIFSDESLKPFYWYMYAQFPLPAYVYLLSSLRKRTSGELCERGWEIIVSHHDKRKLLQHMRTPLHIAYAPLFVKAWDARQEAEAQVGRTLVPPALITILKRNMPPKRARSGTPTTAATPSSAADSPPAPPTFAAAGMSPSAHIYSHAMSGPGYPMSQQRAGFEDMPVGGEMDPEFITQIFYPFNPHPQSVQDYMPPTTAPPPNISNPAFQTNVPTGSLHNTNYPWPRY